MSTTSTPDLAQLTEAQQISLQTYISVTDQDPIAAIPLLQRCEWNVQIAIARFFDGEPAVDPVEEARAAQSSPAASARQTTNLQYESLLASTRSPLPRRSSENVVRRIDTTSTTVPTYRPPFLLSALLTPLDILYRVFSTIFSPFAFLVPSVVSRFIRGLLSTNSQPSRRPLPPADTARRFIREFEETYSPNPPLPFAESGFNLTLDNCKRDSKFLFVVLLSPSHDDNNSWTRETLLSSALQQFLSTHKDELVLWGGSVQDAEGYQVSSSLNCTKFPFTALICQTTDSTSGTSGSTGGDMTIVMRATGPMPASELVAKLGTAITAQQAQLRAARAQRSEQQASRNLRQEQDSAYERSLAQDRERARKRKEEEEARLLAEKKAAEQAEQEEQRRQHREQWRIWKASIIEPEPTQDSKTAIRISIRMIDGERVIRRFRADAELEDVYAFVECRPLLSLQGSDDIVTQPVGYKHDYRFRLVSPMPRAVFELEQGGTIGDRIGKGANLIVEPITEDEEDESDNEKNLT